MAKKGNIIDAVDETYSSKQIAKMIRQLIQAQRDAERREREEEERKVREEEERKAREEEEKRNNHVAEVTCMDLPMDWNNVFNDDVRTQGVHTESIPDALILSLTTLGMVDIEYIASITGEDYKTVITTLKGSIYQNPDTWGECFYKGWETADEYLSGNLMRKWKSAEKANKEYNGYFRDNLRAIEEVLPPAVPTKDIFVTLGSPWIPPDIIDDFIVHLFGRGINDGLHCPQNNTWVTFCDKDDCLNFECDYVRGELKQPVVNHSVWGKTIHDELTGTWEIPNKSRYYHNLAVDSIYGTQKINALHILEKTLNMKSIVIKEEISCPTNSSGKKRVINSEETLAAIEKQKLLIKEFQKWVWKDKNRKERLEIIFENQYSSVRRRSFDGSFLTFPGMSPNVSLYPYQKNAAARIIFSPNTLQAHEVGSGKTYVMIAAGQELRRMGLSQKNLYVVPNNIVGQWKDIFLQMYPDARILTVDPKSFTPSKRERVLEDIRDNDYDGIIMAYSCFELIPLSKDYYLEEIQEKKKMISGLLSQKSKATSKLKRKHEKLQESYGDLLNAIDDIYDMCYFDELGITRLFVDEAHNFKNVPIETHIQDTLGISSSGSKRCRDMMDKVHMVQRKNNGKGVVFATGTPITNSITDAYVMQMYLQSGELGMLDLQSFDGWVGMFAEKQTEFEIDVDTNKYRMATRFTKFHNIPELTSLLASVTDFHQVGQSKLLPKLDGYSDALIGKTHDFVVYLDEISSRADNVRNGSVSRKDDNMLKITSDGRKAALDLRLVDMNAMFTYQSKVARCAENAADIYHKTMSDKSTQIIFCDTSTPKQGFNIYDELKKLLIQLSVPSDKIMFIHDAETEKERKDLFAKMRKGDVRVLIGSTFKLGIGVNVQDRLIAIHHIDVPWRPADMTQREGRIMRQGNTNEKVQIFRYITEGSFDAYSWQLLETKQRFISALLSGAVENRSMSDVEDTVLDYAEVKAIAIGNPLIKERVETANELDRLRTLQRKLVNTRLNLKKEKLELPGKIKNKENRISMCQKDIDYYQEWKDKNPSATDKKRKKEDAEIRKQLRERLGSAIREHLFELKELKFEKYRGFDIIIPANLSKKKTYIYLSRNCKYYVELGDTDVGNLIRIDNFLESLDEYLREQKKRLAELQNRQIEIENELLKENDYSDQINECKKRLEDIDKQLGVDKA